MRHRKNHSSNARVNNRIIANLTDDKPLRFPMHGGLGVTGSSGRAMKYTFVCPNENCSYASREFIVNRHPKHYHDASHTCPIHQLPLINIGFAMELPKKGRKRKSFILRLLNKK